ncbi:MAG: hypothetical protein K2H29_01500 [Oscillospiraceae bacterium]|nr:hypothetical protein [Oscillospiraceae bacterium]
MEKTRIVITNGKENIGVFLNNPDATTKELLAMHCCLVNVIIRDIVARSMTVAEAIEAIGCSDNDAIRMYVKTVKGEE